MEKKEISPKELEDLGRQLQDFFELGGYVNKWRALKFSALKGIAQGFGIFIGGSVVVALVAWMLSAFDQVPLVKSVVEAFHRSM